MGNNVSLQKFQDVTTRALSVGVQYMQEKAMAMKLADEKANTQTTSLEQDQSSNKQRN
jgi:hypothetical protein